MRTRTPDFFLVGAPKCGTTAMHAYLRQHPQVFLPAQKELHYYGSDLHGLPTTLRPEQHDALFEGAGEADRVGVTAIWALYSREAAREIKAAHPGARIVIMLRDPVEMMYALHSEYLYQAIEDIGSFPTGPRGRARTPVRAIPPPGTLPGRHLLLPGDRHVLRAGRALPRDVRGEPGPRHPPGGPGRDPASVIRGLLTFLDVDPAFAPEFPRINVNKRVRSVAFQHLLYNPTRPARRLLRRMFPFPAARRRLVDAAVGWNVVRTPRQPLSRDLRQRLQAEFAPEVDRLGRLLGRDLASVWNTRPPGKEEGGRMKDEVSSARERAGALK